MDLVIRPIDPIKPKKYKKLRKYRKILIAFCIFFLIIGVYRISGVKPITEHADFSYEKPQNFENYAEPEIEYEESESIPEPEPEENENTTLEEPPNDETPQKIEPDSTTLSWHDIELKDLKVKEFSKTTEPLNLSFKIQNKGSFDEIINITAELKNNQTQIKFFKERYLDIGDGKEFNFILNLSDLDTGIYNLTLKSSINIDKTPENNQLSTKIKILKEANPENLVLIILSGAGWSDFNEQTTPKILEISNYGHRAENMLIKNSEVISAQSTLLTSRFEPNFDSHGRAQLISLENSTLMDTAPENYSILGIMPQGDTSQVIAKMDLLLYDTDNLQNFTSNLSINKNYTSENLINTFQACNNLSSYTNYNQWVTDSANSILKNLSTNYILIINYPEGNLEEIDEQIYSIFNNLFETSLLNRTILAITSDSADENTIPFIIIGPKIRNKVSYSPSENQDIAVTLSQILNFSEINNSNGQIIQSIFGKIHDIGIKNVNHSELIEKNPAITQIHLKNFGDFEDSNELCIKISAENYEGNFSKPVSLIPDEGKPYNFEWTVPSNGTFFLEISLNPDNNTRDKNYSEILHVGEVHDLGIEKIHTQRDSENPLKLKVKTKIRNYGSFKENQLHLNATIENKTKEYGPYSSNITVSKTISSTWTMENFSFYNITFQILNYSNFSNDSNKRNNLKTVVTFIGEN